MANTVDSEVVLVERNGPTLTITINRPHRKNALDNAAWSGLLDALRTAAAPDIRVVVITGAGSDFCAGADLSGDRGEAHPLERMRWINEIAQTLHDMPKPVIAKVRGVAVGAGWNLALVCDFVVASQQARFSQIFARRGLSVDFGGTWLLPRKVGMLQAKRLALLGDFIDADEALDLGLATWVKPEEELDQFVDELADRLAQGPPAALAQTKAMLHAGAHQSFAEALANEARAQTVNFATDAPAALEAFRTKSTPKFAGEWLVR